MFFAQKVNKKINERVFEFQGKMTLKSIKMNKSIVGNAVREVQKIVEKLILLKINKNSEKN